MPGTLLHLGATVRCMHPPGGEARPMVANQRVRIGGKPIVTSASMYAILGCPQNPPCATGRWQTETAATRVQAGGAPVLLRNSQARCLPTGTGLNIVATQSRVKGT
jgi:uncharacterized Zn-binding protein involved in type VI secretion